MKNLFATTAMTLALGLPTFVMAQTAPTETAPAADVATDTQMMSNFLASRGATDMLASDLIGHEVYARRTVADMQAGTPLTTVTATDMELMDNVGKINDIVLSADGSVEALVIGVGGFIGVGEQDVAVTLDQVSFATDATNPDEMFVVINTTGDMLKTSPAFDRTATMNAAPDPATAAPVPAEADPEPLAETAPETMADRELLKAPVMEREGYMSVAVGDISVDMLLGKTVYGADDSNVGTVEDVIVDDAGSVKDIIIDFGGFLGMGSTQVALSFDELSILTNEGNEDVRVYVDATKEQVEAMPTYKAVN